MNLGCLCRWRDSSRPVLLLADLVELRGVGERVLADDVRLDDDCCCLPGGRVPAADVLICGRKGEFMRGRGGKGNLHVTMESPDAWYVGDESDDGPSETRDDELEKDKTQDRYSH